jgi:gliding motility-associated-like protein
MEGYKMTSKRNLCEPNPAMKYLLAIIAVLTTLTSAFAQVPSPIGIDKVSAGATGLVTIQGSGFGGDKNDLVVYFGAAKGVIETATDQIIEVHAPAGATYDNISVTNIVTGFTGYTRQHFLLSFGAAFGFDPSNLVGQTDFSVGAGLFDLCMCDFNNDGKTDVAAASDNASPSSTTISILTNNSPSPGTVSFSLSTVVIGARTLHIRCGDLNADGKQDLVISEGSVGQRVFILQNNSAGSISFMGPQMITIPDAKPKNIQIADLDNDGRPELVVSDQGENRIVILVNQSAGTISFSPTQLQLTATGAVSSDGLVVDDFNGDNLPDIITSQYLTSNSNLYVFKNSSSQGNIAFENSTSITISGSVVGLKAGDLDGDRKPDLAVTQLLGSSVSVLLNTSSGSAVTFGTPKVFTTDARPWGIDFGDLDGDGKADIVVASIVQKSITVLNNISSAGSADFQSHIIPTTFINRHVNIGDVDGDGKPDIAFTSIDDNNNGIPASKVSVFRNKTCMVPKVTPEGPITICAGFPLQLTSTVSNGATYEWKLNGTTQTTGTNAFFNVTASGTYTVTAMAEGGTCSEISNSVVVNVGTGTATGTAVAANNGPACAGNTLSLSVNNVGATQYLWTGPDGYIGSGLAPAPIANFQLQNAGRYFVDVMVGTCIAQRTSTLVEIIDIPEFSVVASSGTVICQGSDNTLTVSPSVANFTYQWVKDGANIAGATAPSFAATTAGVYSVKAKYSLSGGCQEAETDKVTLTTVTLPVPSFTAPASACENQQIKFTNQSTTDGSVTPVYNWAFESNGTSTEKDPEKTFPTEGVYTVTLTVSYSDNACAQIFSNDITIIDAPSIDIVNPGNKYTFCDGDSLLLNAVVGGAYTSIVWNTGETAASIYAKEEDTYSIDVQTTGCLLHKERAITTEPAPAVLVTATPEDIAEGESSQLEASGLANYTWTPADGLSSTTIFNPVASPLATTVYTVKGLAVGFTCPGIGTIQVTVKGEPIVNKLTPAKFFSPNQDDKNPVWLIENILDFEQCGVTIYDDKGVKVYEAKPYLNDWDGTFNGQKLPDGVYYYIIRCEGEENKPRTGSITLLR